ncbi:MAG TPA: sulfotransferase [Gemmatimonadales bacterium]|nr:sulfotransferase [Gemmatimonadales bacterium]
MTRRCVIVAGFPRSGTSWVAKCLSFARGFTYYREPDNYHFVPGAEKRFATLYLTAEHDDPAYRRHLTRAAAGEIATARTMRQDPGPLLAPLGGPGRSLGERFPILFLRKRHVLLKLVYANLNLAWLSANLPQARQVCLLRHPCGTFESWQRLGWDPAPRELLENQRLVADHLAPFADLIRSAQGYWERAGALWAATALVLHRQTPAEGRRIVVAYEWLCGDPVARFEELYRRLEMTWSPRAERFIRASDGADDRRTYSMTRPTARQADKWKQRLSADDVAACRRFVEPFGLPYYPDFGTGVSSGATA